MSFRPVLFRFVPFHLVFFRFVPFHFVFFRFVLIRLNIPTEGSVEPRNRFCWTYEVNSYCVRTSMKRCRFFVTLLQQQLLLDCESRSVTPLFFVFVEAVLCFFPFFILLFSSKLFFAWLSLFFVRWEIFALHGPFSIPFSSFFFPLSVPVFPFLPSPIPTFGVRARVRAFMCVYDRLRARLLPSWCLDSWWCLSSQQRCSFPERGWGSFPTTSCSGSCYSWKGEKHSVPVSEGVVAYIILLSVYWCYQCIN